LEIVVQDPSALISQVGGMQGLIELYTTSSIDENRIFYDMNPEFQVLALRNAPSIDASSNQMEVNID